MLRSNSKKAIANIRNYIVNHSNFEPYGMETPTDFPNLAKQIMHTFYVEMMQYDRRRLSIQNLFIEWLSGLPSVFDSCYYYNRSAVADVAEILEESEEEANKYSEAEAENLLSYLIFRELYKACNYCIK